jgi:hypothetical protein
MAECVFDASFIGYANGPLDGQVAALKEVPRQLLATIETVIAGRGRLRCNPKLLEEYDKLTKVPYNDLIVLFITLLDSERTTKLKSNTLRRQDNAKAEECGWPQHDRHVLAAAVGGTDVTIHITEPRLGRCSTKVWRVFKIRVNFIAYPTSG